MPGGVANVAAEWDDWSLPNLKMLIETVYVQFLELGEILFILKILKNSNFKS